MDEIQKILVNAGRKDLAQKYYQKISKTAAIKGLNVLDKIVKKINVAKKKAENVTDYLEKEMKLRNIKVRDITIDANRVGIRIQLNMPKMHIKDFEKVFGTDDRDKVWDLKDKAYDDVKKLGGEWYQPLGNLYIDVDF